MTRGFILLSLFVPLLCACTTVDDPFLNVSDPQVKGDTLAVSLPPGQALAAIPGKPPLSVRQTKGDGKTEQIILYANATDLTGENALTVTFLPVRSAKAHTGAPTAAQVEAELRDAFPGLKMGIRSEIGDNAYGAFGFATAPIDRRGSCVYAWQTTEEIRSTVQTGFGAGAAVRIRLRYCDPVVGEDRLVALMEGLRLGSRLVDSESVPSAHNADDSAYAGAPVVSTFTQTDEPAPFKPFKHRKAKQVPLRADIGQQDSVAMKATKVPMPGAPGELAAQTGAPPAEAETGSNPAKNIPPMPSVAAAPAALDVVPARAIVPMPEEIAKH